MFQFPKYWGDNMNNFYWLNEDQMERLQPYFPKSQGRARVDDRCVLRGIIFINRNGLRWSDAPPEYGAPKTLYNRWKRWSDMGVFARVMEGLAAQAPDNKTISIDATYLKAHRTASSLGLKKGITPCIPGRTSRSKAIKYDKRRYKKRNRIENIFGRLQDWRRIATRYDRCPKVFCSAITLAATVILSL